MLYLGFACQRVEQIKFFLYFLKIFLKNFPLNTNLQQTFRLFLKLVCIYPSSAEEVLGFVFQRY